MSPRRMTGRGLWPGAGLGASERWALSISGREGSISFPKTSPSRPEKNSVGWPPSVDSIRPRMRRFCRLLRPSRSMTLAVSLELFSRRLEHAFSSSLTRWLRSSEISSREHRRWPWSSTVARTWSNFVSSRLKEVLKSVANAERCWSSSAEISSIVKLVGESSFFPDLPLFEAILRQVHVK